METISPERSQSQLCVKTVSGRFALSEVLKCNPSEAEESQVVEHLESEAKMNAMPKRWPIIEAISVPQGHEK